MSLDGVAENPNLFFTEWDDAADAAGADWIATQEVVILGPSQLRRMGWVLAG